MTKRALDINDVIDASLKMLRRFIGEDITVRRQSEPDLWPVKMDPSQVDQVLTQLCIHARDAIKGVGKVTIETRNTILNLADCAAHPDHADGEYVVLSVQDDGVGMDQETLTRVFEPFFATQKATEGTGLGLPTVYGIVTQNRGFIDVHSEVNQGTTVKIYLPRYPGDAEEWTETAEQDMSRGHGETILVVEDDRSVLRLVRAILTKAGYRVLAADDPLRAIEMVTGENGPIDLLITDVVMPEMTGRELAEAVTSIRPDVKVLLMSGYERIAALHYSTMEKGVRFIDKPFTADSLTQRVRELIGEREINTVDAGDG